MKAKKSFGQHFLHRQDLAKRIVDSLSGGGLYSKVLEVGPGKGVLTQYLLEAKTDLWVVEADRDMVEYLKVHFPGLESRICEDDFLKVPLPQLMGGDSFALIGNFPYNISSQIVIKMLECREYIPEMVGMFQKEVADRIVAKPGSKTYGILSVLTQAYYEGKVIFNVDKGAFQPPPKVQSAVIRLTRKTNQDLGCDYQLFRQIVKGAFGQRRKMLRNTLKPFFPDPVFLENPFFNKRPEQLSLEEYVWLTQEAEKRRLQIL